MDYKLFLGNEKVICTMKDIYDQILNVLSSIENLKISTEIHSIGLEMKEEYFSVAVMNVYHTILQDAQNELQEIVTRIENDYLKD